MVGALHQCKHYLRQVFIQTSLLTLCLGTSFSAKADVILHAFNWSYESIGDQAEEIASLGYRYVMPATPAKSVGGLWWARYQPQDYRVIDHPLGNKQSFEYMINELKKHGVEVIADIVLNHMANESFTRSDLNYPGLSVLSDYIDDEEYYEANRLYGDLSQNFLSALDFNPFGCIGDYLDPFQAQHGRICGGNGDVGLPDISPNAWVIKQQQDYVKALKELGVTGFRIDAAKHMTLDHIRAVFTPEVKGDSFVFGEVITYGGSDTLEYQYFLEPYLRGTDHLAYDFPLLDLLKKAFTPSGRLDSVVNAYYRGQSLESSRAILVATTHDVANSYFDRFLMTPEDEDLANAYILGKGQSKVMIYSETDDPGRPRWKDLHKRESIANMISFHNKMKGENAEYLYASKCVLVVSRGNKGIMALNKCSGDTFIEASVQGKFAEGTELERNIDANETTTIQNGNIRIELPARSVQYWVRSSDI